MFIDTEVRRVRLPGTLRLLGAGVFKWRVGLRKIELPDGLESIGCSCFVETKLEEITIPKSVICIYREAFYRCHLLKRVIFQEGSELERIETRAFGETALEHFEVPDSLQVLSTGAFCGCAGLARVELPRPPIWIEADRLGYRYTFPASKNSLFCISESYIV